LSLWDGALYYISSGICPCARHPAGFAGMYVLLFSSKANDLVDCIIAKHSFIVAWRVRYH
jgi:hypothetical protein